MEKLLGLVSWFAGQINAKLSECCHVYAGKNYRGMRFASPQLAKLPHGKVRRGVCCRAYGKGNKYFVRMQARVVVAKVLYFQVLYRPNYYRGNKVHVVLC